jgi:acyl-CoA synthetase (AMP-forming)/AMP-acid ligase II
MALANSRSVRQALLAALGVSPDPANRFLYGINGAIRYSDLLAGSTLEGRVSELSGRSVLIQPHDQLAAAAAMIELDGRVRRMVLATPDLPAEHLASVVDKAAVDWIVTDHSVPDVEKLNVGVCMTGDLDLTPTKPADFDRYDTEWVLLTSGTSGVPKLVVHSLESLTSAIVDYTDQDTFVLWATFYDIRRYGGLQIFLRAVSAARSLALSDAREALEAQLVRFGACGVTHISGTPSHWRRALWSPMAQKISPKYVRLSGEIADQAILDSLHAAYPNAAIGHAYASTEGGVGFAVDDGREGFPAAFIGERRRGVEMKIVDGSLRIRSGGLSPRYLGDTNVMPVDKDGFIDTGDLVELRGDRYFFMGRKGGIINVGGLKVYPEEVEAVINRHSKVRMSHVYAKKNPIVGYIVVADVVLTDDLESSDPRRAPLKSEIIELCRQKLTEYKAPAIINFVGALKVTNGGKLVRSHA